MADGNESPSYARIEYQSARLYNWDRLRVFGSLDILGLHLTGTHLLSGVGLPTFLMMSIALTVRAAASRPIEHIVVKRVRYVVVPWLFWSGVLAAEILFRRALGDPHPVQFKPEMLLYGPEVHLWFLPFVAIAGSLAACVQRFTLRVPEHVIMWATAIASCISMTLVPCCLGRWPLEQWAFSVPAVCLGFGLGSALSRAPHTNPIRKLGPPFLLCALIACLTVPDSYLCGKRYVYAMLLILLCDWLPNRPDPVSKLFSPLMLGVYVLHMLVYHRLIEPVLERFALQPQPVARVLVTFLVTASCVALCRFTPLRRVL